MKAASSQPELGDWEQVPSGLEATLLSYSQTHNPTQCGKRLRECSERAQLGQVRNPGVDRLPSHRPAPVHIPAVCVALVIMSHCDEILAFKVGEENEDAQDGQHLESGQLSKAEMGMAELPSSTTASFPFEEIPGEVAAAGVSSDVKGPQCSPAMAQHIMVAMAEKLDSHPQSGNANSPKEKGLKDREEPAQAGASLQEALYNKMSDLVGFLVHKYRTKQLTTKDEMLNTILNNDEENFSYILSQVSECVRVLYGIDVKEVDPQFHIYALVTTLGLTYDGMVSPQHTMPTTGLLVIVLGVILLEDDCASEQAIWEQLSLMGVYPERKHFIYGKPRELLTNVWVQEQYLDYQREPGSYPARYQFLWGPRAHAETNKVKVMEFLLNIYNSPNRSLLFLTDGHHSNDRNEGA
ncbi:melanoma-associated antigen 9-like [Sorex fumeus]|uniref:melanoma-associated antigen 9-like n=1 Tax=Sorex fumeus TaxID=62283 RepID=UPI0024AE47C0|nr:melanoma-associated antigen 9-like [Sorex fumeus]